MAGSLEQGQEEEARPEEKGLATGSAVCGPLGGGDRHALVLNVQMQGKELS